VCCPSCLNVPEPLGPPKVFCCTSTTTKCSHKGARKHTHTSPRIQTQRQRQTQTTHNTQHTTHNTPYTHRNGGHNNKCATVIQSILVCLHLATKARPLNRPQKKLWTVPPSMRLPRHNPRHSTTHIELLHHNTTLRHTQRNTHNQLHPNTHTPGTSSLIYNLESKRGSHVSKTCNM
jgi:hypothetical protein